MRQGGGGSIVLHKLCKMLSDDGFNAKVFLFRGTNVNYKNPKKLWSSYFIWTLYDLCLYIASHLRLMFIVPPRKYEYYLYPAVKGCHRKFLPFYNRKKTIVVYPEIVYGNFLKSKYTIRWFLNKNYNPSDSYGQNDLFIAFREIFNDKALNPESKIVTFNCFNRTLYKRTNFGERSGKCYIIRKGKTRHDLPEVFDGTIVDDLSDMEKVKEFNTCEYCISYDMQTYYTTIAAICGCKVVLIPEAGKTKADYRSSAEKDYGIAFGFGDPGIYAVDIQRVVKHMLKKAVSDNYRACATNKVCGIGGA